MISKRQDPRQVFGAAVLEVARDNSNIIVLSADSGGSSGFGEFRKEYPDRYFEFGIMEQCVVGVASGLATAGKIPVFCAIAPFVTCRPYEMFRNDLGYMRQNVKIVGRNCGISYSDLGPTHHSLEDIAIVRMIPGVTILSPEDPGEINAAVRAMLQHDGPVYMRIGNQPIQHLFNDNDFSIGRGRVLRDGKDLTIVVTGTILANVLEATDILIDSGLDVRIVAMPTVWPIDSDLIVESARQTGKIVTVEEHYVIGGLGTIVQEVCTANVPTPVKKIGIPCEFATSGPYEELLAHYGLNADGIANTILRFNDSW